MEIIYSLILGIIQGLTEFIPISSSGHLVVLHQFLDFEMSNEVAFDVALHLGTVVALIFFFYKDIIQYLSSFLNSLKEWNLKNDLDQRIAWFILISMIPAGFVGFFLDDMIESLFRYALSVAVVLIIVSFLFILAEKYSKQNRSFNSLTWQKSLFIGIAQALALIPGVSRSGITIVAGMMYNMKRETAARFSFLMSIPIILAAGLKKMLDLNINHLMNDELMLFLAGFLSASIIGFFTIKYLLLFLKKYPLTWFAYYRIILGIIIIIYLI